MTEPNHCPGCEHMAFELDDLRPVADAALVWFGGRFLDTTSAERGGQSLALVRAVHAMLLRRGVSS